MYGVVGVMVLYSWYNNKPRGDGDDDKSKDDKNKKPTDENKPEDTNKSNNLTPGSSEGTTNGSSEGTANGSSEGSSSASFIFLSDFLSQVNCFDLGEGFAIIVLICFIPIVLICG